MPEKLFDYSYMLLLVVMFFVCASFYNIGYFGTLGDSIWYFFYVPTTIFDIIKTGFMMIVPMTVLLLVFKPILLNPILKGELPSASFLMIMSVLVLISNFLYFAVFINSSNQSLSLLSEIAFYIFSLLCLIAVVYYFFLNTSPQILITIFLISLLPISLVIGLVDARIASDFSYIGNRSQILLQNNKVVSATILRSFEKGIFVKHGKLSAVHFISADRIQEIKFGGDGFNSGL
ncbi:MAG: hypothetical protein K0R25_1173 [Rickettsiaceae bacterium]|jgi:hypothetical protein|nr:hypothetical protein [Rickettsiaceae bacterium]